MSLPSLSNESSALVLGVVAILALVLVVALVAVRQRRIRRLRQAAAASQQRPKTQSPPPRPTLEAPVNQPVAMTAAPAMQLNEATLARELRARLAGTPLNVLNETETTPPTSDRVIWVEHGHEVLVHLDSLAVHVSPGLLQASIDVEADQTGRTTVVVPFALSEPGKGSLIAVTEERPRGDPAVVSHWGTTIQEALWAALLGIAVDMADQQGHLPTELAAGAGVLHVRSAPVAAPDQALAG